MSQLKPNNELETITFVKLNRMDIMLIQLALETTIQTLMQRFEVEPGYIHPSKNYQALLDKINTIELEL